MAHIKSEVRNWDERVGDANDTSLLGRRPADETARRLMRVEVASLRGRHAVLVMWDMQTFVDSLDARTRVQAAQEDAFPLDQRTLGLMVHRAPRVLRVRGCYGEPIARTGRSVLAGCTLSTSFARAYLCPLRRRCGSDQFHTLAQHVDDLTQLIVASTPQLAALRAIRYGRALAEEAIGLGLTIADKSRVVASSVATARTVASAIRCVGHAVPIFAAPRGRGLGRHHRRKPPPCNWQLRKTHSQGQESRKARRPIGSDQRQGSPVV